MADEGAGAAGAASAAADRQHYMRKGMKTRRSLRREETAAGRMAAHAIDGIPGGFNVYDDHDINEKHLADAIVECCGRYIRHCPQIGWMAYNADEGRWTELYAESAVERVIKHFGELLWEGASTDNAQEMAFARRVLSSGGIAAVKKILSMDTTIAVERDRFDPEPFALNCMGEHLDLRTGEARPSEPEDMHSKTTACRAAGLARAEGGGKGAWELPEMTKGFEDFMRKATSKDGERRSDLAFWILSYFGYCLTGETGASFFVNFHGMGKNGKSVLLNLMLDLFGDYAATLPQDVVIENQFQGQFDLAGLPGIRLGVLVDAPEGRLNMDQLKSIVSGDAVNAKRKYMDDFKFRPICKVAVGSNPRLTLKDTGMAVRRRIRMVPFDWTVPEGEEVANLHRALLRDEGPQILALLAWFANQYYANGEGPGAFPPCAVVDEASAEYMKSEDLVGRWKEERTEPEKGGSASTEDLYQDFKKWATEEGVRKIMQKSRFSEYLAIAIPEKKRVNNKWNYVGIRLKQPPPLPGTGGG